MPSVLQQVTRERGGLALVVVVAAYATALSLMMQRTTYDYWGPLVVAPVLLVISVPLIGLATRYERDTWLAQVLWAALVLKLLAAVARWYVAFVVYNGNDAGMYSTEGWELAQLYRDGVFTVQTPKGSTGTGFMIIATAVLYTITGPTFIGGFLVFSWLGYWGLVMMLLAARRAVPGLHLKRYALLLLLLPSMLFWPSSIGKEAWMLLCIGATAHGFARATTGATTWGWVQACVGLLGTALVRPHITVVLFGAMAVAWLLRPTPRRTATTPVTRGLALLVMAGAIVVLMTNARTFLGVEGDLTDVESIMAHTEERTNEGGSTFTPTPVRSLLDLPMATLTVLFRPLPHEAHSLTALIASAEGAFLLVMVGLCWRRLAAVPAAARRSPYVLMALPYALGLVVGFSTFGNFGLLTRERVMLYPLVLLLLCVPLTGPRRGAPPPRRGTPARTATRSPEVLAP